MGSLCDLSWPKAAGGLQAGEEGSVPKSHGGRSYKLATISLAVNLLPVGISGFAISQDFQVSLIRGQVPKLAWSALP